HLLLAAAAGRTEEVSRHIRQKKQSRQLLTDLYYVALDFNKPVIALEASRKLHQQHPDQQTLAMQTRAFVLNNRYREALPGLAELHRQEPAEWEFAYFDALEKLGEKKKLLEFWRKEADQPNTSPAKKREVAFLLLEKGFYREAENLFLRLAAHSAPDSQAVEELLYLWGKRPRPNALAWLENRLQTAPLNDKASWLRILAGVGQETLVLRYIETHQEQATPDMIDMQLEILVSRREIARFKTVADREIKRENQAPRLKRIAAMGAQLGLEEILIQAYEKGYRLAPDDREILNEYGKMMFYQGQYTKAEELLGQFIKSGGLDYVSTYIYAELLWRRRYTDEARIYYQKAEELISFLIKKNLSDQTLDAKIKVRLGKKKEALALYRDLRKQHPDDTALKAEYVELLIDMGYTEEAEKLLTDI
ncbi:tetratricopeptide repeat protein, partial [bacterium]|nr:tetratricopeptide repeat protein [bacterium]